MRVPSGDRWQGRRREGERRYRDEEQGGDE